MAFNLLNFKPVQQPPKGLLGPYYDPAEARRQKIFGAMSAAGAALLQGGQGSFGQVLGQGLAGAAQGAQQAGQDYQQNAMDYQKMANEQQDRQRLIGQQNTEMDWKIQDRAQHDKEMTNIMDFLHSQPPDVQAQIGKDNAYGAKLYMDYKFKNMFADPKSQTSEIQNYEYLQKHPGFADSLKGPNAETIYGTGLLGSDNKWYYPKKTGQGFVSPELPPGVTLQDPGAKAAMIASGKMRGAAQGELPGAIIGAQNTITKIDALLNNPDLPNAIGYKSWVPDAFVGNGVIDVRGRVKELLGGAFLEAYNTLKGGGQITEVEGSKAQAAYQRMETAVRASDPVVFKEALNDFKTQIDIGIKKLAARAGQSSDAPQGVDPEIWNEMTPEQKALWQ